jgi:methyl acetate hydrolase
MPHKPTRRDLLKTTATVAVTSALALNRGAVAWAKEPADATAGTLPKVDAVLRAAVSAQDVPGLVAMAATETGVVYEGVFGSRRIHEGPEMTRDTIFRVASMVKLITTVAALRLVEQGKLSLEAPVPDSYLMDYLSCSLLIGRNTITDQEFNAEMRGPVSC